MLAPAQEVVQTEGTISHLNSRMTMPTFSLMEGGGCKVFVRIHYIVCQQEKTN
jgi:hypothetical protein